MSKKGLGRGLQALLPDDLGINQTVQEIPIEDIIPNPDQPRKDFDPYALQELADSIIAHGLLQPILVKPCGQHYCVIAGERRLRAAKIAGLTKITVIIQDCTEQEMAERALIENIQRTDLSPIEEGKAYARLIEEYGMTQEMIAQRVGKGRTTITNLLRIITLPNTVLDLLSEGKISLGHAKLLVGIKDTSLQVLAAQKAAKEQLSVRETEDILERLSEKVAKVKPIKESFPVLHNVEDRLRTSFQTKVFIKGDANKGKIEIQYFSEDELNRLLELWNIIID